jgi:hypothetical protein
MEKASAGKMFARWLVEAAELLASVVAVFMFRPLIMLARRLKVATSI